MRYGLALDCIFRACEAFRNGGNLDRIFQVLRSLNVRTVEINAFRRFEFDEDVYEKKLRFLSSLTDISVTLHNGNHELSSLDNDLRLKHVRLVCSQIEFNARFFQPELIVLHPGPPIATDEQRAAMYARLRESTLPILDCCQEHGVKLVYENMRCQYPTPDNPQLRALLGEDEFNRVLEEDPMKPFPRLGGNIARLLEFVRSFHTPAIGLCIDTGHAHISEGDALADGVRLCGKHLFHVHTSDNFGINDNHLPPGMGKINWKTFYAALHKIAFPGTVLLEITPTSAEPAELTTERILALVEEDCKHFSARGDYPLHLDEDTAILCERLKQEGPR